MPGIGRAVAAGFLHHVIQRGNNREDLSLFFGLLPNARQETIADLLLVFRISGQIPCEKALLVIEPPYQKWHHGNKRQETPKRAQAEGRAD